MTTKITLQYRREGETYAGALSYNDARPSHRFSGIDFKSMMTRLAKELSLNPDDSLVVIDRTDREGLVPYFLDRGMTDLLRNDPAEAIRNMTVAASPVPVPIGAQVSVEAKAQPLLRVGRETLAESFGEHLYCRTRNTRGVQEIECPGCGRWVLSQRNFKCPHCHLEAALLFGEKWAEISVEDLLESDLTRFYFPRIWNGGRPWITREDLQATLNNYRTLKEKASCSTTRTP